VLQIASICERYELDGSDARIRDYLDKIPRPLTEIYEQPIKRIPEITGRCPERPGNKSQWTFQHEIGSGSFGTVFLEYVQPPEVPSRELCAVKRISKDNHMFPRKSYMREIDNSSQAVQVKCVLLFILYVYRQYR